MGSLGRQPNCWLTGYATVVLFNDSGNSVCGWLSPADPSAGSRPWRLSLKQGQAHDRPLR